MINELPFIRDLHTAMLLDIAGFHGLRSLECDLEMAEMVHQDIKRIDLEATAGNFRFFTRTLPEFGRAIDRYLITGVAPESLPETLATVAWLWNVFLTAEDPKALQHVRQLSYLFYKYETPLDPEAAKAVIESFVGVESQLRELRVDSKDPIIRKARAIICRVLSGVDHRDIIPRHGPGAVATGEGVVEKTRFKRIYRSLESVYPFTEYMCFSLSHVCDTCRRFPHLEVLRKGTAKVVLVPKDSRGPRLISCEPLEFQWIQQGLATKIVDRIESHPLTRGHVNFTDQMVNRRLAVEGSVSLKWDTLDMKDASDRVSVKLVRTLFQGLPLLKGLLAARTTETRLPDGKLVHLEKFAPMGSALCFPVEALVFYALAVSVLQCAAGLPLREASRSVYVYGDDIIIDRKYSSLILSYLPKFGLMFNLDKCATSSIPFRESCGADAYKGVLVTPLRVKRRWKSQLDPMALASYVAVSNGLYEAGYTLASEFVEYAIRLSYPDLPYSVKLRSYVSFVRPYGCREVNTALFATRYRHNRRWMRREVKAYALRPVVISVDYDSWEHLLRRFSIGGHETRAGQYSAPRRAKLIRGWYEE